MLALLVAIPGLSYTELMEMPIPELLDIQESAAKVLKSMKS